MFSVISKLSVAQVVRPLAVGKSVGPVTVNYIKHFSTTESNQNSRNENKGLSNCLFNEKKINCSLRTLSNSHDNIFDNERREFLAVYPDIVHEITNKVSENNAKITSKPFDKVLEYNTRGKNNRGLLTVLAFKAFSAADQLTPDNIRMVQYLGWCVEVIQAMIFHVDDIIQNSLTRHDQKCWQNLNDVGVIAINDAFMIESAVFGILKNHFHHTDYYANLLDIFHEGICMIIRGQSLNLITAKQEVTTFTMEIYKSIVKKKVVYGSFYYPFTVASLMADFKDEEVLGQAKAIFFEIGQLLQAQDDFQNCFGNPGDTAKIGTDIQENKCTWLAVNCMQQANDAQREIMANCYGQNDPLKIARVKQLYVELGLPNIYAAYAEDSLSMIQALIQNTSDGFPDKILMQYLKEILHRKTTLL